MLTLSLLGALTLSCSVRRVWTNPTLRWKSQHQFGAVFWMAYAAPFLRSVRTSCCSCRGFFWTVMKTQNSKRAFSKLNRFWGWKVLLKHTWSNAACYPNLIWPCFHNPSVQTDKTARAPLLQLVCLESLQRLGANDLQTDSPAGLACPAALCFLCLYLTVLEPM